MAQVFVAYVFIELFGISQITIVCQNNAEWGADIKRLSLCAAARIACSRIADMCNACITDQVAHIAGTEHFAHHAFALVHMKYIAFGSNNTCCVLTTVLQHLQTIIQHLIDRLMTNQT